MGEGGNTVVPRATPLASPPIQILSTQTLLCTVPSTWDTLAS